MPMLFETNKFLFCIKNQVEKRSYWLEIVQIAYNMIKEI
jgi:hypothetical protein